MLAIAERYVSYHWVAAEKNILHQGMPAPWKAPGSIYLQNDPDLIIDTPDIKTASGIANNGWWTYGENGEVIDNISIPYFWGGTTIIGDDQGLPVYLKTNLDNGQNFSERLALGYPAGDTSTNLSGAADWGLTNGVDCTGFIDNVWRMGTRFGMSLLHNPYSRPIKFKDIRPGDILMYQGPPKGHVMLFKEFVNYSPGNGEPVPGVTKFRVYQASWGAGKVVESEYTLATITPIPHDDQEGWFRDSPPPSTIVSTSDRITIQELPAEDGATYQFTPRTYFTPIDVELVIDASGTTDSEEFLIFDDRGLVQSKLAAKTILDFLRPGDKVGIVAFSSTATTVQTLTEIVDANSISALKQKIDQITVSSGASIFNGLQKGEDDLEGLGYNDPSQPNRTSDPVRVMFLMSDGVETNTPYVPRVTDVNNFFEFLYGYEGISIYTLQVGFNTQLISFRPNRLLPYIANQTGGYYSWSVTSLLEHLKTRVYGATVVKSTPGTTSSGGTNDELASVDSSMGSVTFSLLWSGSALDLTLERPDGILIDPSATGTDRNVSFVSGATYASYTIHAPQPGQWTIHISGAAGQAYEASVSTVDGMALSAGMDKKEYFAGEPIKFTASIQDSISPVSTGPEYIHGVSMQVTAEDPAHTTSTFALYDDGLHEDGAAEDGVYAGVFGNTSLEGIYSFDVEISGNNNRAGQPFTREKHLSVVVNSPPTVVSIVRASPNPTASYNMNFTVTFSKPVRGVDLSDFALTVSGISGAKVSVVSGSGSTYTVSVVNPGAGSGTIRLDVLDDDTITDGVDLISNGANGQSGAMLGGTGAGNGDFTAGETYNVDKTTSGITVSKLGDTNDGVCDTDCSLREAIAGAAPSDIITFGAGLSGGSIHLASFLTLSRNVTLDGSTLAIPIAISGDTDNNGTADVWVLMVNAGVTASLNSLTITKGKSAGFGISGGVTNNGQLTVTNSTFSNNSAAFGAGAGIYNNGDHSALSVVNSTFSGNSAGSGGAIYNNYGTATITNSTFSGNSATTSGGGIYNHGVLTVTNSTFSGNSAATSGGAIANGGRLNYTNTILANSTSGGDCINASTLGTNTKNLVEDGSCSASLSGDPNLGPLANNGGSTQTMALLNASPAIDAGDNTTCANAPVNNLDQRGVSRPQGQGAQCDIGAYEKYVDPVMPAVDTFTTISYSTSLDIQITAFTASDDMGVTGYLITTLAAAPLAGDAAWSGTAPTMYTVGAYGNYNLYPWAKDAAGNVSPIFDSPRSVTVSTETATPTRTVTPTSTRTPTITPTTTLIPMPTATATATTSPNGMNLALNKPATASGNCGNGDSLDKAVNGIWIGGMANKWCDSSSASKWWQVDLGAVYNLSQFVIYHTGAGGAGDDLAIYNTKDFNIQVSMDNVNWTTVTTVAGNTSDITIHNVTPTNARYVKLNVTAGEQNGSTARIYEVQVYDSGTPIFHTIFGNAGVAGATLSYNDGGPKTATAGSSDNNGKYSFVVPYNWSGTVTPSKTGYTFTPASRTYTNVTTNMTGENYTVTLSTATPIPTPTRTPTPTLTLTPTPTATTSLNGINLALNKPATASDFCSGETADKAVNGNWIGGQGNKWCDFSSASKWWQVDLGAVYDLSQFVIYHTGAGGASDDLASLNTRDFNIQVSMDNVNWTTVATVAGNTADITIHNVAPTNARYVKLNVTAGEQSGPGSTARIYEVQVYNSGTPIFHTIFGNAGAAGATLSYNDAGPKTATAGLSDGKYSFVVPYNWSGTLTPAKTGYTFTPASRTYTNLVANQAAQNYTAVPITYTISGNAGVAGAILSYFDGSAKTATSDGSGNYSLAVSYNWSGTVTPSLSGVTFTPANRSYTNVIANQTGQSYSLIMTFPSIGGEDGWILESTATSGVGGTMNSGANIFRLGDEVANKQYRAILSFSTASLPDTAFIQSAVLEIKQYQAPVGTNPFTALGNLKVDIRTGVFNGVAALELADFNAASSESVPVATFNETPVNNWYSATLNSTGISDINKLSTSSGRTQLRLRFSIDDNNNGLADYMNFLSGEASSVQQPVLTIIYTVP